MKSLLFGRFRLGLTIFALLLAPMASGQPFSPALELQIRPIVRSVALELILRSPTGQELAIEYLHMSTEKANLIDQIRLSAAKKLVPYESVENLSQAFEFLVSLHLQRLEATGSETDEGRALFDFSLEYLNEHGATSSKNLEKDLKNLTTKSQLKKFVRNIKPKLEKAIAAIKGLPAPAYMIEKLQKLSLTDEQMQVIQHRILVLSETIRSEYLTKFGCNGIL